MTTQTMNIEDKEPMNQTNATAQKPRFTLPRDPNKAMTMMMVTIDRLRASLIDETNALKDSDTQTFLSLQDTKLNVARDYLEGMGQLLARKDELQSADEGIKSKLEIMRNEFSDTAHENHAALQRMQAGMKRLGERIMETAREAAKKEDQIIYGSGGRMQEANKATMGISESA